MFTHRKSALLLGAAGAAGLMFAAATGMAQDSKGRFGFGDPASPELIKQWAIAIPPDGEHLPPGGATAKEGEKVYAEQCVACHGDNLQGVNGTGGTPLIGGRGTLASKAPKKTVESYWPYATTLFDYVHRAMPFTAPGSLTPEEVYAVTAYILYKGDIIEQNKRIDAKSLPSVAMPNKDGFVPDPRPDVINYR
jgi:S-disulfanyl-L-cysteine oxidoreductase SoxD